MQGNFEREKVTMGAAFTYKIYVVTPAREEPRIEVDLDAIPWPEAFEVTPLGRSFEYRTNNGLALNMNPTGFQVVAKETGIFTVPEFTIEVEGEPWAVPAATVEIIRNTPYVTLEADVPKQRIFVGERVSFPVAVRYQLGRLENLNAPSAITEAFAVTWGQYESIRPYREDGREWSGFTWPAAMTALRTGEHELSFEANAIVVVPSEFNRRFSGLLDLFPDRQQVTLTSGARTYEVLPLPIDGQPAGFSGAIGDFEATLAPLPSELQRGQPVTLELAISGTGNFRRFQPPAYDPGPQWRSFGPESFFEMDSDLEISGTRRIQYTLIPQATGELTLPDLAFSYFDPETETYREETLKPTPLEVKPTRMAPPAADVGGEQAARFNTPPLDLLPEPGRTVTSLQPWVRKPSFWLLNGALLAGAALLARRQQQKRFWENNPLARWRRHCQEQAQASLEMARKSPEPHDAWHHAAWALRWAAAALDDTQQPPEPLTPQETLTKLAPAKWPEDRLQAARKVLDTDEALRYGRRAEARPADTTLHALGELGFDHERR
ncbi:MAG: BatD family protein [Opitutales bacterium]